MSRPPKDANVLRHDLASGKTVKVLTPVQVEVVLKNGQLVRVARLRLLGLDEAQIATSIIDANKDLLRQGMWGITELADLETGITVIGFKPMQASLNIELFKEARREFTLDEWRSLTLISMGYAPEAYPPDQQTWLLSRLLPLVQKNTHLMELAPKATGKSYLFENISPKVRLVSGGNVSPAVLFVNNASGQWGLLARFSVVVLDEVQTLRFEKPEEIVGGLKGYLANGTLTRGGTYQSASDCSLVLLANIMLDSDQQPLSQDNLVGELPMFLQETAFLDRFSGIIPGWKVRKLGPDCFANTVGLKADFFGDAMLALRDDLTLDQACRARVRLGGERPYARNENAVKSLASGLAKILFPHGEVSREDLDHYCVQPAVEMRQNIWDQLYRLDAEYRGYQRRITASAS